MPLKIYIASDHAGFEFKGELTRFLKKKKYWVTDLGPDKFDPDDDYPDFAAKVCQKLLKDKGAKGILVCGTGQGMDRVANKFPRLDAAVAWDRFTAEVARDHGKVGVLCLGARTVSIDLARKIVEEWLKKPAKIEMKHQRRIDKIRKIEEGLKRR